MLDLLSEITEDEQIGAVTPDDPYDTRRYHEAIIEHGFVAQVGPERIHPLNPAW